MLLTLRRVTLTFPGLSWVMHKWDSMMSRIHFLTFYRGRSSCLLSVYPVARSMLGLLFILFNHQKNFFPENQRPHFVHEETMSMELSEAGRWRGAIPESTSLPPRECSHPSVPPQCFPHLVPRGRESGSSVSNPPQCRGRVPTAFLCTVISSFEWQETIPSFSAFLEGWLLDPAESQWQPGLPSQPDCPQVPWESLEESCHPTLPCRSQNLSWCELLFSL